MLIDVPDEARAAGRDVVLLAFNASHEGVTFALPESPLGGGWRLVLDTDRDGEGADVGVKYALAGRSAVLFEAK
jgi:glycogen operon protein